MRTQSCGFDQTDIAFHTADSGDAQPYMCASLLKPLLFWAAAHATEGVTRRWLELAEPAVVLSANEPTAALWDYVGGDVLLEQLEQLAPVGWRGRETYDETFGGVPVCAVEVAEAYAALALRSHGDAAAAMVLAWMQQVPREQTFEAERAAARALDVDVEAVARKSGWFITADSELCTHTVCLAQDSEQHWHGAVVLTGHTVEEQVKDRYLQQHEQGLSVLPFHWADAADELAATTTRVLTGVEPPKRSRPPLAARLHLPRPHLPRPALTGP